MFTAAWAWLANNPVARKIALWTGIILAALIGYNTWKTNVQAGVRRQEREAKEREQLKSQAAVAETRRELEVKRTDAIDRGNEAVAHLPAGGGGVNELRHDAPSVASELLGSSES